MDYNQAMGLHRDPFEEKGNLDLYYAHQGFSQRLSLLKTLVRGSDFLVLVMGEEGSGKTMLRDLFLESVETTLSWRRCRLRHRCSTTADSSKVTGKLHNHQAHVLPEKPHPIVMVDDVHRLSRNELAQLLKAPLAPDASFGSKRLILFCEPHLNPVIEALYAELGIETPISRIHMPAISRGETAAYLEHRLRLCGYEGHPPFKAAAIRKIHTKSMGVPAEINRHARVYLAKREVGRFGSLFLLHKESSGSVGGVSERTWLLLGFFLVAVFLFFESGSPFRAWLSTSASQRTTGAMTASVSHRFAIAQATSETQSFALNLNPKPAPPMVPAEARQYPVTDRVVQPALSPADTMPGAIAQETETPPAVPETGQAPPSASPATAEESLVIHDNAWLLVQTPMAYTIQFIAARNKSSLVSLVHKHRLDRRHQVALLETDHQGRPWYQGYYGVFESREEALVAMDGLPLEIQQANPFVIRISAVQAKIKPEKPPIVIPHDAPVFIARLTSIPKKPA